MWIIRKSIQVNVFFKIQIVLRDKFFRSIAGIQSVWNIVEK